MTKRCWLYNEIVHILPAIIAICMVVFLWVSTVFADDGDLRNDTFNTIPDNNASFMTNNRTFLDHEQAQREGRIFSPFVDSGGMHSTSSTLTSAVFATEAFVPERINQTGAAITYAAIANDVCWTIISSDNNGITGWTRVGTTAYYYQCEGDTTPNQPVLPSNSTWLMRITVTGSAIASVVPFSNRLPYKLSTLTGETAAEEYNIVCDGVTDTTSRVNFALAAINAQSRGGSLVMPLGTCLFSSAVNMTNMSNVKLRGIADQQQTVLQFTNVTGHGIDMAGCAFCSLENLLIQASGGTPQAGIFMMRTGAPANAAGGRLYIHRVGTTGWDVGLYDAGMEANHFDAVEANGKIGVVQSATNLLNYTSTFVTLNNTGGCTLQYWAASSFVARNGPLSGYDAAFVMDGCSGVNFQTSNFNARLADTPASGMTINNSFQITWNSPHFENTGNPVIDVRSNLGNLFMHGPTFGGGLANKILFRQSAAGVGGIRGLYLNAWGQNSSTSLADLDTLTGAFIQAGNAMLRIDSFFEGYVHTETDATQLFTGTGRISGIITRLDGSIRIVGAIEGLSGTGIRARNLRGSCVFGGAATCQVTFATAETNNTYFILLGCSTNQNYWYSGGTTTGFVINADGASTGECNWLIVR